MKAKPIFTVAVSIALMLAGIQPTSAQSDPLPGASLLMEDPVTLPEAPTSSGTVEGTGTHFAVTDSEYINLTMATSESVKVRIESVPHTIAIDICASPGVTATQTQVALGGFTSNTTYHMYQDSYANHTPFTTDADGAYAYVQDLSTTHIVFIQPVPSTYFLPPTGSQLPPPGSWDAEGTVFTLSENVNQGIQIQEDGITLDGNGHTIDDQNGVNSGNGIFLNGRTNVTVRDVTVIGFDAGIRTESSSLISLEQCTFSENYFGIYLSGGNGHSLTGNIASNNSYGFHIYGGGGSALRDNTATNNENGINLSLGGGHTLTDNTVTGNAYGMRLQTAAHNVLTGNVMSANKYNFWVHGRFDNTIDRTNTVDGKKIYYITDETDTVYDSTNAADAGTLWAINCSNITVRGLELTSNCYYGLYFRNTNNSLVDNVTASGNWYGIYLALSGNNTLTANNAVSNDSGIRLETSGIGNTLTANTASDNTYEGIALSASDGNTLNENVASGNRNGIVIGGSDDNVLTDNTATNNTYGFTLGSSEGNTLTGNTMEANQYNFRVSAPLPNHIDLTNTIDGKWIYYIYGAEGAVYDSTTAPNAGAFYAINCTGITVRDLELTASCYDGMLLHKTHNSTIENLTVSNHHYGIHLDSSNGNTLAGNGAVTNNAYGISLRYSNNNTLDTNTISANSNEGCILVYSDNNVLSANTVAGNFIGINLQSSDGNSVTGNSVSLNRRGIELNQSSANTVEANMVDSSEDWGIILNYSSSGNLVTGNISSNNRDGVYVIRSNGNTVIDNTVSNNSVGIRVWWGASNNIVENNTVLSNSFGIYVKIASDNTFVGNAVSENSNGITLENGSSNNTLESNMLSTNRTGIWLFINCNNNTVTRNSIVDSVNTGIQLSVECNDNQIYNNNFINNPTQPACSGTGNIFNLDKPIGGNYWSNWAPPAHPDADGDGFVDEPYVFYGSQDNFPWASQDGWLNLPPVADAGGGQTVHPGTVVTLDGSASSDPDEDYPLTYLWEIIACPAGSVVELVDPEAVSPSFMPDLMGDYTFQLIVTDSRGLESPADEVTISTYNTNPAADAGSDQALLVLGTTVQLGTDPGRESYDEDGDEIAHLWTICEKPAGSAATLDFPDSPTPTFVADVYGAYEIVLVVTDCFGAASDPSDPLAQMTVSFDNVQPVAVAGGTPSVYLGQSVYLDGSGSYDVNEDPLDYSWSVVSKPEGSLAQVGDPTAVQTGFVPDVAGTYIVSLVVNDGHLDSTPSNLNIQVISTHDAIVDILLAAIDAINNLDDDSLKNKNMKKPLVNKINATLSMIDNGLYLQALDKLATDVLQKMNGCAEIGEPDRNDWLVKCEAQAQVYPLIMQAIELLVQLTQ